MLYFLLVVLVGFWLLGQLLRFGGQLIHLALLAGLALLIVNFFRGRGRR